jgi:AcrR family transcriptional regulator
VGGRSARVVDAVLTATIELTGQVGYTALRVEDVARRAGVNRTTVYRRWPTKVHLIAAALRTVCGVHNVPARTGTLRAQLIEMAHDTVAVATSTAGQSVIRMLSMERGESDLEDIRAMLYRERIAYSVRAFEEAYERGELEDLSTASIALEAMFALVYRRLHLRMKVDQASIETLVDIVLRGVSWAGPRPPISERTPGSGRAAVVEPPAGLPLRRAAR